MHALDTLLAEVHDTRSPTWQNVQSPVVSAIGIIADAVKQQEARLDGLEEGLRLQHSQLQEVQQQPRTPSHGHPRAGEEDEDVESERRQVMNSIAAGVERLASAIATTEQQRLPV